MKRFRVNHIVNNVKNVKETNIGNVMKSVANNYLSLDLDYLGHINHDPMMDKYINEMSAYFTNKSVDISWSGVYDIVNKMLLRTQVSGANIMNKPDERETVVDNPE
ncbi:MAG: hypothetical protein HY758_10325 [Nitrospirae bacterium]|nr:hypothetical protein [Nitrospirota bacterium]